MAQRNGVLDTSYLTPLIPRATVADGTVLLVRPAGGLIGSNEKQWATPGAAAALFAAAVLFKRRTGKAVYVLEAFRSETTQRVYYDLYRLGKGNLAAYPGTSNHGWGLSFDLASSIDLGGESYRIFKECAEPYGLFNDVASEKWHWTFYPLRQQKRPDEVAGLTPADSGATPFPTTPTQEEDDMSPEERQMLQEIHNGMFDTSTGVFHRTNAAADNATAGRKEAELISGALLKDVDSETGFVGIRGMLQDVRRNAYQARASAGNIETILAGAGNSIRSMVIAIKTKLGA